jgi:fibronectin-binding autotransporter adhesin
MKTSRTLTAFHLAHKAVLAGVVFTLTLAILSPATYAGTTWDGGGVSGNWSEANNWNANALPGSGLTLTFAGALQTITNNDYFAAGTTVNAFDFTNDGTIGKTGNFTLSGNSVTNTSADIVTTAIAVGGIHLTDTISLNIALNNNKAFVLGAGHDLVISGTLSGSRNITKNGAGTLTLSAGNTYTGSTTINAGTLSIATITNGGVAGALGNSTNGASNLVLGGGTLQYTGSNGSTDRSFTLSNATTSVIDVSSAGTTLTISGGGAATTGGLTKNGSGTLLFTASNSYTGDTTVNSGILQIGSNNRISDSSTLRVNGGTFNMVTFNDTVAGVILSANGTISGTNPILTSTSDFILENGTAAAILAGTVGVNKTTSGTVILTATNTYSGTTTISAGTLQIGNGGTTGALSTSSAIANNGTLTFNRSNNLTQGTNFASVISGAGNVTQAGTGILTLSGNNTYTGTTTISAGTLALNNAVSNNSTISGDILINGGTLNYGNAISEQISNSATVTLSSGSFVLVSRDETIGTIAMSGGDLSMTSGVLTLSSPAGFTGGNISITAAGGRINTASSSPTTLGNATFSYSNASNASQGLILSSGLDVNANTTANFTNALAGVGRISLGGTTKVFDVGASANLNIGWAVASTNSSGGLTKNGTGTLTLSAANTYTGATTINAGILQLSGNGTIGSGAFSITGGELNLGGVNITNTFTGLTGGTLSNGTITNNSSIYGLQSGTVSAVLAGSNGLTKNGTGTLTLSATNTYSGTTTLNAGTLAVSGDIANSGLVINSGGIISPGTSAAADSFGASSITINGGGYNWTLSSANGSAGTGWDQITSTGALTSSGLMTVYAYGTPGDWDNAANYSWDIISANSVSGFSAGNFTMDFSNFGIGTGNRTGTWAFSNPSGGIIRLSYTAASDPVWAGGTGSWDTGFTPAVTEGANIAFSGAGGTATNNISTGILTTVGDIEFRTGAGAYTLAADAGAAGASGGTALTINGSITNNSTNTQTLNTDLAFAATRTMNANTGNISIGGVISGSGGLTKNGSNKLTLTGGNTYSGATTINTGTLEIGSGSTSGSLSASSSIINNASLVFNRSNDFTVSNTISGTGDLTKSGAGTLTLSGASSSYSGTTAISAGTIQLGHANGLGTGGNITFSGGGLKYGTGITTDLSARIKNSGSAILVDTNGETVTWGTSLGSTNSGGLTKNGTGTLTINSTSAYTGATAINGGKLVINNTAGTTAWTPGAIAINNAATLEFSGSLTILENADDTITFDSSGGGAILLTNNVAWRNAVITTTGGLMNTITGAGVFNGQNAANSRMVFYTVADGSDAVDLQVSVTHSNVGINKSGSGTLALLNATNNMDLGITINAGTLEIGATGRLQGGSYTQNITNNGALVYSGTSAQTLSGIISGTGALTQNAASTLTLSGSNTYTGTTTITAGTLQISSTGLLGGGNYSGNIANSGALIYSGTNDQTLSGVISGSGALTQNAASALTLSNTNSYSGATTINAGTLQIGNGLSAGSLNAASAITVNGTLSFNRSDAITQGTHFSTAAIGGTGSIVQNGTGTLTLNAANTYSGGTTLNTGTLIIGNAAAAGTGTIAQSNSSSLLKFDTTGTITNAMSVHNVLATQSTTLSGAITVNNATWDIDTGDTLTISGAVSGNGGVTKTGGGTLTLNGTNTYNGSTIVNAGTLNANSTNALGSNNTVQVNGGTLLVTADDAINGKNIELGGSGVGLRFSGTYNGSIGLLTLSANSIIDLGTDPGGVIARFSDIDFKGYNLSFYNWKGQTLWGGTNRDNTDQVYIMAAVTPEELDRISFYSGNGGDSFLGTGFELGFSSGFADQIIPVPEPETYATGLLLLLGGAWWMWKRNRKLEAGKPESCSHGSPLPCGIKLRIKLVVGKKLERAKI